MNIRNLSFFFLGYMLFLLVSPNQAKATDKGGRIEWPVITNETKPWTRWWWMGSAVNEKNLSAALKAYNEVGLGGVEITPIYGVHGYEDQFLEYLSSRWVDMLVYTLQQSQRLGLGVDMANAAGWPFGGPWVDEKSESKNMVSKTFYLKKGQQLADSVIYWQDPMVRTLAKNITYKDLKYPVTANQNLKDYAFAQLRYRKKLPLISLMAYKIEGGNYSKIIDLSEHLIDGKLDWTAPEGEWLLCALFMGNHGKMVERAAPGGEGFVVDHFSSDALRCHLNRFNEAFKGRDISYLRCFFNDSYEVDDASGQANWTPLLFDEFKKLHHYDLRDHIPALIGKDTEDNNSRVLYDYRTLISQLLLENFTGTWRNWALGQDKGIRNQAHGSPANILDLYAASDIPETEGLQKPGLKIASSAAHVTGKRLISAETCTWLDEHFKTRLEHPKSIIDEYFLAGINHIFYHGTAYSPQDAPYPGWLFYAAVDFTPVNSFWDDLAYLNQYVTRVQSFLQAGRPSNDILLYYPISDYWSDPSKEMLLHLDMANFFDFGENKKNALDLSEKGYSWDVISDKLLDGVSCNNSGLFSGGNKFRCVLVPKTHYMPVETFENLLRLANAGASVLFLDSLPNDVPSLANLEKNRSRLKQLKNKLTFENVGELYSANYGKGKIIVSPNLFALTNACGIVPENMYLSGLQCVRRMKDDNNFYYFVKNSSQPFEGWVSLNVPLQSAVLYNPLNEMSGFANCRINNGKTEVYLQLKPEESLIIETCSDKVTGELYPFYKKSGNAVPVSSEWTIKFTKGGPTLPKTVTADTLKPWIEYGADYEAFSGTAEYVTTFSMPDVKADAWLLELENMADNASVFVNGKLVEPVFEPHGSVEIPSKWLTGNDELKIVVSNSMSNRIIDLDKKGANWQIFYDCNFAAKNKSNRGSDGKFSTAKWKPEKSGVWGKVKLTPLSYVIFTQK